MNNATAIVAWADISKIDLAALSEFGMKLNPIESPVKKLEPVRDALIQLGVKRIYFVGDLSVFMPGPMAFIVPVSADKAGTVRLVLGTLVGTEGTVLVDGDAVLYGDKALVEKLQTKLDGPPDASFLKTINGLSHSHSLAIRTSASAMQPLVATLPEMFGDNADAEKRAGELLLKIRSVAVSGELPPAKAKLQIELESMDSAIQLAALLNEETTRRIGNLASPLQLTSEAVNVVHSTDSAEQLDAVIWTKPEDVEIALDNPLASIINETLAGIHACLADGAARYFSKFIDADILRAVLTIDGGEIIDFDKLNQ